MLWNTLHIYYYPSSTSWYTIYLRLANNNVTDADDMVTANMLSGTSTFRWLSKVWIVEMTQAEDKWFVDKIQQGRDTKATVLDKTNMNQSNWGLLYRTWFVTWFHSVMCDQ